MTTRRTLLIASALGAAGSSSVFAHSDEAHADKAAPAKKEQKPWGIAGDDKAVKRTVTFTMTDNMRFTPDKLAVKQGETVKLVIKNKGKVKVTVRLTALSSPAIPQGFCSFGAGAVFSACVSSLCAKTEEALAAPSAEAMSNLRRVVISYL